MIRINKFQLEMLVVFLRILFMISKMGVIFSPVLFHIIIVFLTPYGYYINYQALFGTLH